VPGVVSSVNCKFGGCLGGFLVGQPSAVISLFQFLKLYCTIASGVWVLDPQSLSCWTLDYFLTGPGTQSRGSQHLVIISLNQYISTFEWQLARHKALLLCQGRGDANNPGSCSHLVQNPVGVDLSIGEGDTQSDHKHF